MHGRNKLRDHMFLFVNMYLMYCIGEAAVVHREYVCKYCDNRCVCLRFIPWETLIKLSAEAAPSDF